MTKDDKRTMAARRKWTLFGEVFGWRLFGWTYYYSATFCRKDGQHIRITAGVREDIIGGCSSLMPAKLLE